MGGAMRQSGIIASMCLYALDNNVQRLSLDHTLADNLGNQINRLEKVKNVLPVETNIIIFDLEDDAPTAEQLIKNLKNQNILIGSFGERRIRIVTHLDVGPEAGQALMKELTKQLTI